MGKVTAPDYQEVLVSAVTSKEVQERVGHSSAVMTLDRYAHAPADDTERKRRAVAMFPAIDNVVPLHKRA